MDPKLKSDTFYAVFEDGNVHESIKFDNVKNPNSLFYLKRIFEGSLKTDFGNYHIDYSFDIIDKESEEIVPEIGGMKIIQLSAFDNTQGFVQRDENCPKLRCKILDTKGNIKNITFRCRIPLISNLKCIFKLIDEVNSAGGFIAYELLSERTFEKNEDFWYFKEWK